MPDGYAPTASLHAMGCTGANITQHAVMSMVRRKGLRAEAKECRHARS